MAKPTLKSADPLPCGNQPRVIQQIQPTIDFLRSLDTSHPDLLKDYGIDPADYHSGLVFRSAIESIRGTYIASSTPGREKLVEDVLIGMRDCNLISDYDRLTSKERWDFEVLPFDDDDRLCAIEVKGGEGNSINISVRPDRVKEFAIWSHLDGSIQHPPSKGAKAVIGRITNELSARGKQVDFLLFKDTLCGTRARPCPKYPGQEDSISQHLCPDIYLFPQRVPTTSDPHPPSHTLDTTTLPIKFLKFYGIQEQDYHKHIWNVDLMIEQVSGNRYRRLYSIIYNNQVVAQGRGKPFTLNEQ